MENGTEVIEGVEHELSQEHTGEAQPSKVANQTKDKFVIAKSKLEESKKKIQQTDSEIEDCIAKIEEDLNSFKREEEAFVNNVLKQSQQHLKELGASESVLDSAPEPKVDLVDPEIKNVQIKKISRGRLRGFTLGLLASLAALGAWCYMGTQALGLPLLPSKIPDMDRLNKLFAWTSEQIGQGSNVAVGATVLGVALLAIWFIVYWLTKSVTVSSSLKTATKIEEETEFYCQKKGECKEQMEKVREHIARAKELLRKYEVILDEQNAKIRRARVLEDGDVFDKLHHKTQDEIRKIKKLSSQIENFLHTPMAEYGILSKEGLEALEKTNKAINDHIMEIYG